MNNIFYYLLISCLSCKAVLADEKQTTSIAIINMQKVAENSEEFQKKLKELKDIEAAKVKEFEKINKELEKEQKKIQSTLSVLTQEKQKEVAGKFQKKVDDVNKQTKKAQAALSKMHKDIINDFVKKTNETLSVIAKDNKIDMVIDAGAVVWSDSKVNDLTSKVSDALAKNIEKKEKKSTETKTKEEKK